MCTFDKTWSRRFWELFVESLPHILEDMESRIQPGGNTANLLETGSPYLGLAVDYFLVAYTEACKHHRWYPPGKGEYEEFIHRHYLAGSFRQIGIPDSTSRRILDEFVFVQKSPVAQ